MRHFFFTLRTHPSEQLLFEDALAVIIPFVKDHECYAYVVEKDDSPDRHLHFIIYGNYKDKNSFARKLHTKPFKKFAKLIASGFQATNQYSLDTQMLSEEKSDMCRVLGYIFKEPDCIRREVFGYEPTIINDGIRLWNATERLKAREVKVTDSIIITAKNAEAHILSFLEKMDQDELSINHWYTLKLAMTLSGYRFFDISEVKLKLLIHELQLQENTLVTSLIHTEDIVYHTKLDKFCYKCSTALEKCYHIEQETYCIGCFKSTCAYYVNKDEF